MLHIKQFDNQTQEIISNISHLFDKYEMDEVYIFGSRARGDHKESSDIDLVYRRNKQFGIFHELNAINFKEELQKAIPSDAVNYNEVINNHNNKVAQNAKKEMILIYEKD